MSGMLFLLFPLILSLAWCWLTALLWKVWRRKRTEPGAPRWRVDATFAVLAAVWLSVGFWYGGGRKTYYDMEVNRLCAVDGGVKVYETVKLPTEKFNKWGQINFYKPTQGVNTLGPEYLFKRDIKYFRKGDPETWRTHVEIVRRNDNKLMGEVTHYSRRGGDLPGPWHPSSFGCPREAGQEKLIASIFQTTVIGDKK